MPSTTNYNVGDIVLVAFPFTDLSGSKQRPALVIRLPSYSDVLVAAITSQIPASIGPDEFEIPASDLGACGLPKRSIVRLSKVVTLHEQLVRKRLGRMPSATFQKVTSQFRSLF